MCPDCKKSFGDIVVYNEHMENHRTRGSNRNFLVPQNQNRFHKVVGIKKLMTEQAQEKEYVAPIKQAIYRTDKPFSMPTISKSVINRFCKLCNHLTPSRIEHANRLVILWCKKCKEQTLHSLNKTKVIIPKSKKLKDIIGKFVYIKKKR